MKISRYAQQPQTLKIQQTCLQQMRKARIIISQM